MSDTAAQGRGRPPVFSEEILGRAAEFSYARHVGTRRGAQDLVYRMFAVAALDQYREAFPEEGAALDWLLTPVRRHTLLTELGRIGRPRTDAHGVLTWDGRDVVRLVDTAFEVAFARPSTKAGVRMIRDARRETAAA